MVDIPTPASFLAKAIRSVPAVKYALGIAGIVAVIAIVRSWNVDFTVAILGSVVMLVLMAALVIFANLASLDSSKFQHAAFVFTWFSLVLVMAAAALLFTSVFLAMRI